MDRGRLPGVLLFDQQQHLAVFDLDRKGLDIFRDRLQDRLSSHHVKPALMKRALDFIAFEKSLAKPGMAVGADVRGSIDIAIDTIEGDVTFAHRDRDDIAFGYIVPRRYGNPFSTHRHLENILRD